MTDCPLINFKKKNEKRVTNPNGVSPCFMEAVVRTMKPELKLFTTLARISAGFVICMFPGPNGPVLVFSKAPKRKKQL